jgi:hypothetical protein
LASGRTTAWFLGSMLHWHRFLLPVVHVPADAPTHSASGRKCSKGELLEQDGGARCKRAALHQAAAAAAAAAVATSECSSSSEGLRVAFEIPTATGLVPSVGMWNS